MNANGQTVVMALGQTFAPQPLIGAAIRALVARL